MMSVCVNGDCAADKAVLAGHRVDCVNRVFGSTFCEALHALWLVLQSLGKGDGAPQWGTAD